MHPHCGQAGSTVLLKQLAILCLLFCHLLPVIAVLSVPAAAGPQVRAQRERAAPRPEAVQPAPQCQLRPQDLRLWAGPKRGGVGLHDGVRCHAMVPRARAPAQLPGETRGPCRGPLDSALVEMVHANWAPAGLPGERRRPCLGPSDSAQDPKGSTIGTIHIYQEMWSMRTELLLNSQGRRTLLALGLEFSPRFSSSAISSLSCRVPLCV